MTTVHTPLIREVASLLSSSNAHQRMHWANRMVAENVELKLFLHMLTGEKKTAIRLMWFLTEIGTLSPKKLCDFLPTLFDACEALDPIFKTSFASYWLITGVPEEQETKAIELMFHYALSLQTNVTIKARAVLVLFNMTKKYPALKNELKLCIHDQLEKYSKSFDNRMLKVLKDLEE